MPRPPKYPIVPETRLTQGRWRIQGQRTLRVERGSPQLLRRVNEEWLCLPHGEDDPSEDWRFHVLGEGRAERFVVLDEVDAPVAAWLDHDRLVSANAYRLDYFKVRSDRRGRGLGQLVFGLIGLRARERRAERIVFQPLKGSEGFYRTKMGATPCDDWKGGESLPNFQIDAEALKKLVGVLDEHGFGDG